MSTLQLIHTIAVGSTVWFLIIWVAYIIYIEDRLSKGLFDNEDTNKAFRKARALMIIIVISALSSIITLVLMTNSQFN